MRYGMLTFEEPKPDSSRKILHVDMDAFYASVEMRDQPQLKKKPLVIARHPRLTGGRGIVTTCNYRAREFGIHSAMAAQEAYHRCPQAIFIPPRIAYYRQVSAQIRDIFQQYTDVIEPLSLDEAYLDVTHNHKAINSGTILAQMIQAQILDELNLTCSIGVSYNKFIAKIASDVKKPFGITVVEPERALDFLADLPIEDFYGVGKKSVPLFHELGIYQGSDLKACSLDFLIHHFGKMGLSLFYKVRGVHDAPVAPRQSSKSLGRETTFRQFIQSDEGVLKALRVLSQEVTDALKRHDLYANTVTLKIRYDNFETLTRQASLTQPSHDMQAIYDLASNLWFDHGHLDQSIRLLGVTTSNFEDLNCYPIRLDLDHDWK